ncbi:DUF362 domain-containing protein, partial [Candidatus Latescibacterota bacterium]
MVTRRDFLKATAVAGGSMAMKPIKAVATRQKSSSAYFGVHRFIENHPDAVFIMRTDVDEKMNSEAKTKAGFDFGNSVFVHSDDGGNPIADMVAIKPNMKTGQASSLDKLMGMDTDAWFVGGIIDSIKELGLSGDQFYLRETNCSADENGESKDWPVNGYGEVAEWTGADLRNLSAGISGLPSEAINMTDVPDGVFFNQIPHLWPVNSPDSFLLNISKFKAHGMGMTLCCKNMQGTVARPNQQFCSGYNTMKLDSKYYMSDALKQIKANFDRHVSEIPRWDKPRSSWDWNSGIGMETWATRTLDNLSTMNFGLSIIEGIYGRDGNGASSGPNPEGNGDNAKGEAWDYMTNVIIFGKNPIHVDNIGFWLSGHEPGNVGLFHLAMERGMSQYLNPENIPVYLWYNGTPTLTPLSSFERTPLMTYYLTRDYDGQTENYWHLI